MTLTLKKLKKGIAMVAVFLMLFTIIPMNANAMETASDISGHWAEETIQEWIDNDWVKGYLDGSFKPDDYITRAEFVALVNRSFQFTVTGPISFTDVNQNTWYASEVAIAVRAGYIQGYNDNTMRPENNISREEAATIIMKINNLSANSTAANVFTDSGLLTWSRGAVGAVAAVNLMTGYPDGTFGPDRMIRRGETVVLLDRSVKYIDEMDAPAAPDVTRDDVTNTVTGMTSAMEYRLDNGMWTAYVASEFDALNLSGNHTLLVRYAAIGILPAGMITTLTFTTASSGGGGGNDDIVVTSVNVSGSAIVGTTLSAITVPVDATGNYQWQVSENGIGVWTDISGATSDTYYVASNYAGDKIRVTFTAYGDFTGNVISNATGFVAPIVDIGPSNVFAMTAQNNKLTITLTDGTYKAGEIEASDFTFAGTTAGALALTAGTFVRVNDTTVTVTFVADAANVADDYIVLVKAATQATQASSLTAVASTVTPVTSAVFTTAVGNNNLTITLSGGTYKTGVITATDFIFTGTDNTVLAAAAFTRTSDTVVTVTGLGTLVGGTDNTVLVKAETQATQANLVTAVASTVITPVTSTPFALVATDNTLTISLTGGTFKDAPIVAEDFTFVGIEAGTLALEAGTFVRTNDTTVTVTFVANATNVATDYTVLVEAATQATQAASVTAVASID